MTIAEGFILGLIQGVTEILPISSTAHLILAPYLLGINQLPLAFDVMMNFGSFIAIIIYFRDKWLDLIVGSLNYWKIIIQAWLLKHPQFKPYIPRFNNMHTLYSQETAFYRQSAQSAQTLFFLGLATIPVLLMGYFAKDWIELYARNPQSIALSLIIGGIFLALADKLASKKLALFDLRAGQILLIGLTQMFSLLPGFSRSGATITGGLLVGLSRKDSAEFAFLLGAPVICLATLALLPEFIQDYQFSLATLVSLVTSGLTTYMTIHFLYTLIQKQSFLIFVIYRLFLGAVLLVIF